jgi:hypothetical protein
MIKSNIYIKNIITNEIFFGSLDTELVGKGDYPLVELSESETLDNELRIAKIEKVRQLKINRDKANIADMISHQGEEVLVNRDLIDTKTGEEVFFAFTTKETRNPATNPYTILSDTIAQGSLHDDYYLRYSCKIIEGDTVRKGYIALDKLLATSLLDHARLRNTTNIGRANNLEDEINAIEITDDITCQEAIKLINDIDIIF